MPQYEWLLFDADGTLFNYDLSEARALENTFSDFNLALTSHSIAAYRKINAEIWTEFEQGHISSEKLRVQRFERLFAGLQIAAEAADFSARYLAHMGQQVHFMEDAQSTLETLSAAGFRMAIITNGLQDVQRSRLALSGIQTCFEDVFISEEIGAAKPEPAYFAAVFARIGQPPRERVLIIGDSLSSDIQGGLNYGLDTCWYNPFRKPVNPRVQATYEITALAELVGLLA